MLSLLDEQRREIQKTQVQTQGTQGTQTGAANLHNTGQIHELTVSLMSTTFTSTTLHVYDTYSVALERFCSFFLEKLLFIRY